MDSNLSLENVQERIVIVRSLFREKERKRKSYPIIAEIEEEKYWRVAAKVVTA